MRLFISADIEGMEGIERTGSARCVLAAEDADRFLRRFFKLLSVLYAVKDAP